MFLIRAVREPNEFSQINTHDDENHMQNAKYFSKKLHFVNLTYLQVGKFLKC